MKESWRTTLCGVLGICAGAIVAADFGPQVTKIAGCIVTAANGVGLLFARDERAAARRWGQANGNGNGNGGNGGHTTTIEKQ